MAAEVAKRGKDQGGLNVLTHCNTGSLATAGFGTALGVVRALHSQGKLQHVYCTETRPYNQGDPPGCVKIYLGIGAKGNVKLLSVVFASVGQAMQPA